KAKEIEAEQVFTWPAAPIRRVDAIEVGRHADRTAVWGLKARPFKDPNAPVTDPANPANPATTPAPGGLGLTEPAPGYPGAGGEAVAVNSSVTQNGILRERYIDVPTEQVARMPVGMVLIVDQANISDVLTTLANSRLRSQVTQVRAQRIRDVRPAGSSGRPSDPLGSEPTPTLPVPSPGGFTRPPLGSDRLSGTPDSPGPGPMVRPPT